MQQAARQATTRRMLVCSTAKLKSPFCRLAARLTQQQLAHQAIALAGHGSRAAGQALHPNNSHRGAHEKAVLDLVHVHAAAQAPRSAVHLAHQLGHHLLDLRAGPGCVACALQVHVRPGSRALGGHPHLCAGAARLGCSTRAVQLLAGMRCTSRQRCACGKSITVSPLSPRPACWPMPECVSGPARTALGCAPSRPERLLCSGPDTTGSSSPAHARDGLGRRTARRTLRASGRMQHCQLCFKVLTSTHRRRQDQKHTPAQPAVARQTPRAPALGTAVAAGCI